MTVSTAPLVSFDQADMFGSGPSVLRSFRDNPTAQDRLMLQASAAIENRCGRRLAPFTGLTETYRAVGVDDGFLAGQSIPLDLPGAIGRDRAMSYSANRMVRDFHVNEYPPVYSDQWTYALASVTLLRMFNDVQDVDITLIQGPDPDTGHVRFNLGLFCPEGSTIVVTYGGGYTPIPQDLQLATTFMAMKYALLFAEPMDRKEMSTAELDAEILGLIAPYIR